MRLEKFAQIVGVIASKKTFNISNISNEYRFDFNQVKETVKILEKLKFIKKIEENVYKVVK